MHVFRAALAFAVVGLAGCSWSATPHRDSEERPGAVPRGDAVLYTIGISTDPYGNSRPNGFGVASGITEGKLDKVELRGRELGWFGGAEWLDRRWIIVHRSAPPLRRPVIYRLANKRLQRSHLAAFISGTAYRRSPDGELLALEPPAPCEPDQASIFRCYRGSGRIYLSGRDGSERRFLANGTDPNWTPDGRLVFYRTRRDWTHGRAVILDLTSGRQTFRDRYWPNEEPLASADGRYLVTRRQGKVAVMRRDGRLVRGFPTRYMVSMVAWSPRGHRLAYTTSGFPDPHELFLVDPETWEQTRIFASGAAHFDWITWSPDGRWLLLDGDEAGGWRVFAAETGEQVRLLPRLGGRPLWCCPVNDYDALVGRSG